MFATIRKQQRGAAAIEFALVFPLLFLVFYGTFVYGYVFFLQQSISFAAQEAALSAVQVSATCSDCGSYADRLLDTVDASVDRSLAYLPAGARGSIETQQRIVNSSTGSGSAVEITVTLDPSVLLPIISLPGIGSIPPLPQRLRAVSVVGV